MEIETKYDIEESVILDPSKTALLIVDMQNDFVKEGGKLRVPDAEKTIEPIKNLLERSRKANLKVFYTQDWHKAGDPEFEIWGEHVVEGTWGAEIIDELKPLKEEFVIRKTRYDGFYGTPLDEFLRLFGTKNLIITGTVANICVLHTAGSAALRFYKVIVPIDCISAITEFDLHLSLRQIDFLYKGILVERGEDIKFKEV